MDAPRGSVELEEADELQRLRRRAYGPDADIAEDAAAQARLFELEGAHRRRPTRGVDAAAAAVPTPVPERVAVAEGVPLPEPDERSHSASTSVTQPVEGAFAADEPAGGSVTGPDPAERSTADSDPINGSSAAPWWRRRRWFVIVGGSIAALALNAALVMGVSQLLSDESTPIPTDTAQLFPVPDLEGRSNYVVAQGYVLALESVGTDADKPKDNHGTLAALGLDADAMRRYEDLGGLRVWSGESRYGTSCLLVAHPGQGLREGIGAEACSPRGRDPIAELPINSDCCYPPGVFEGLPVGSVVLFALQGDHVNVYVYERAADPSTSPG
jgi:hypothetical protein